MKTKTATILIVTILASLLVGTFAINAFSIKELKLKVKWKPVSYALSGPVPDPWQVELYFAPARPVEEVDPSTLLLEGMYEPVSSYLHPNKPRLVACFDGYDVLNAILIKAGHLMPGRDYRVWLEISGFLHDGTPFSGEGGVILEVPEISPP